jgi:L-ascorbate metabolism protein UlaG (beta-lactamase superfamily)
MKITHFSNSFIVVETANIKICCDPWVGSGNYGGWHSFPEYNKKELIDFLKDIDIVYISHLHEDHFDPKFLMESKLVKKKFVIKKFEIKTLFQRVSNLASDIVELDAFQIFEYKGAKLSILPQFTSNSSDLEDEVDYDLDTSIVINDGKTTFFNQVDNPFSHNDYRYIKDWLTKEFGSLDVVSLMCGAASEFPQSFFNIDRDAAKARVINSSLEKLQETLRILSPTYYFPAGGTYFIPGKLYKLNKYIAQPTYSEINEAIAQKGLSVQSFLLEGGNTITINERDGRPEVNSSVTPLSFSMEESIEKHKNDSYQYEMELPEPIPSLEIIGSIFELAKKNWLKVLAKNNINVSQNISFILYSELKAKDDCTPDASLQCGTFKLNEDASLGELKVHIDIRAFYRCLTRNKMVWNGTTGALCMFERAPNVFYPTDTFSLNYLTIGKDELQSLLSKQ